MTNADFESLFRRFEQLERQNRNMRRCLQGAGIILAAGAALAWTADSAVPDVLKAREFRVIDDRGNTRATLGANDHEATETAGLVVLSSDGKSRLELAYTNRAKEGLSELRLFDRSGTQQVELTAAADGYSRLMMFRPGLERDAEASDAIRHASVLLAVDPNTHDGFFSVADKTGKERAFIGPMDQRDRSNVVGGQTLWSLVLYDDAGNVTWKKP